MSGCQAASMPLNWIRPQKVLKTIKKTLNKDGSESVEIRFVLSDVEVNRVMQTGSTAQRRKRKEKRMLGHRGGVGFNLAGGAEEEEEMEQHSGAGGLSLKLGKFKSKMHMSRVEGDDEELALENARRRKRPLDDPISSTGQSARSQRAASRRGEYVSNGSSGNGLSSTKALRLPHIEFAARLEKILLEVWACKQASDFRYPVNLTLFPHYPKIVSKPIALSDIRTKISEFKYLTARAFVQDIEQMVHNSTLFNGAESLVTKSAEFILRKINTHIGLEKNNNSNMIFFQY